MHKEFWCQATNETKTSRSDGLVVEGLDLADLLPECAMHCQG